MRVHLRRGRAEVVRVRPSVLQNHREELTMFYGLSPESQGQNPALTVLHVPYLLDSGKRMGGARTC